MTSLDRLIAASRAFGLAAIFGLALVARDGQAFLSLVIVGTVAMTAVYLSITSPLSRTIIVTAEAGVTGMVIALALPSGIIFIPYLVILTLVAGVTRGAVGVSAVVLTQYVVIAVTSFAFADIADRVNLLRVLSPWLLTSIGAGLLGTWLRQAGKVPQPARLDASYESAHRLLAQLRTVARRLSSGLDPLTMATHIADAVQNGLPATEVGVFVRRDGGVLTPLGYNHEQARSDLPLDSSITSECWAEMEPVVSSTGRPPQMHLAALPLRVGSRMMGVVLARLSAIPSESALITLMQELDEHSLRLDTAITFDEVRSIATVEERRRLAREIHDGVAQDVASLGYLVDDLLRTAHTSQQRQDLTNLREELSRVVNELRLSIFDLRSEALLHNSLGSALSAYLRQVGSRSQFTVHLTLEEAPHRLRAETETELLRIAQEAIANARKHSSANNLWVTCKVDPPFAQLEVSDDGIGLTEGRSDSYGLRIMQERAQRLDARLEIESHPGHATKSGTIVRVTVGNERNSGLVDESEQNGDATGEHHSSARRRP